MKRRIVHTFCLSILAAICFVLAVCFAFMSRQQADEVGHQLQMLMDTAVAVQPDIDTAFLEQLSRQTGEDVRVTLIDASGDVVYDSHADYESMINHAQRGEVVQARATGYGREIRPSETTGIKTIYICRVLPDGSFLRLSSPVSVTWAFLSVVMPPVVLFALLLLVIATAVSQNLSDRVLAPYRGFADALRGAMLGVRYTPDYVGADPELVEMIGTIEQVSSQFSSYALELRRRQNELNAILSSVEDGILVLDAEGEVLLTNRAAQQLFPVEGSFLKHCRNEQLCHGVRSVLDSGSSCFVETTVSSQPEHVYRCLISPAVTEQGVNGAVVSITDITAIHKLEGMRSEFVSNVSHELKSPLTSIRGFAELIVNDMVPDEAAQKRYLGIVISESTRLISIIDEIIHLSQLEQTVVEQRRTVESVDLAEMVQEILRTREGHLAARGISAQAAGTGVVTSDRAAVYDILENLLSNGIKYNREGGKLAVTITQEEAGCQVQVSDTGIGIAPEEQEKIFQRFYRVDKVRSKKQGSTGLGLSIVKHSLELVGGSITLQSTLGEGTTFTVFLPQLPMD